MILPDQLTLRLRLVRREMASRKVTAFLITNLSNIRYLTGLSVSAGALLLTARAAQLFLDGRYQEAGKALPRSYTLRSPDEFQCALTSLRRIAFEATDVTVARLRSFQKKSPRTRWIECAGVVEQLRRTKSAHELASIRRACRITKSVLKSIPGLLQQGISERQLQYRIEELSRERGGEGMAFSTIVAFGEHTSRPHHHPTDRVLHSTDLVQIDMGVMVHGYCSDYSRVFFMTTPTVEQMKALIALKKAKKHAESLLRPGIKPSELDRAARSVLEQYGFTKEFCHSLGHGLGLDIHEMPSLSTRSKETALRPGEVVTIEPGLYFPGSWGMRLEDTHIIPLKRHV